MKRKNPKQELQLGISLYEMNKQLMAKEPLLTSEQLEDKVAEIADIMEEGQSRAWMLLCNERQDFTIFYNSFHVISKPQLKIDFKETLLNRGDIVSIDRQENGAFEIWIKIDNECFCYMFFDYTNAIIDY